MDNVNNNELDFQKVNENSGNTSSTEAKYTKEEIKKMNDDFFSGASTAEPAVNVNTSTEHKEDDIKINSDGIEKNALVSDDNNKDISLTKDNNPKTNNNPFASAINDENNISNEKNDNVLEGLNNGSVFDDNSTSDVSSVAPVTEPTEQTNGNIFGNDINNTQTNQNDSFKPTNLEAQPIASVDENLSDVYVKPIDFTPLNLNETNEDNNKEKNVEVNMDNNQTNNVSPNPFDNNQTNNISSNPFDNNQTNNEKQENVSDSVSSTKEDTKNNLVDKHTEEVTKSTSNGEIVPTLSYFGHSIIFMIPIIGQIFLIIKCFDKKNINIRNFARSYVILLVASSILTTIGVIKFNDYVEEFINNANNQSSENQTGMDSTVTNEDNTSQNTEPSTDTNTTTDDTYTTYDSIDTTTNSTDTNDLNTEDGSDSTSNTDTSDTNTNENTIE